MNRFETKLFGYHYSLTKEYGKYLNIERKKKMPERRTNHEQLADFKVKQQTEGNRGNIPV